MPVLAIETATDACSVALLDDDVAHWRHEIAPRQHTELLLAMIDSVLQDSGHVRSSLRGVAFGCGPGSFTGVRVAASVAQGLAGALSLPVVAVSTLHALAAGAAREHGAGYYLAALDARRQEMYVGGYHFAQALADGNALLADALHIPEQIKPDPTTPWSRTGGGWSVYADRLPTAIAALPALGPALPHARDVARIGAARLAAGHGVAADRAVPVYLRGALD